MSIDYLAELEHDIDNGRQIYACPGPGTAEWYLAAAADIEDLRKKAQRTANAKKYPVNIYRLMNQGDTMSGDTFLAVRKILEPGPKGEPHLHWTMVDTREAAEMLRDVSQGPSPYFGATVEETFQPTGV